MYTIHPAMSVFPKELPLQSVRKALEVGEDSGFVYDFSQIQITPQNFTRWNEEQVNRLRAAYPASQFRFHASVRLGVDMDSRHKWFDLSRYVQNPREGRVYFEALSQLNKLLGSPAYTFHTGFRPKMRNNFRFIERAYREIEDIMESTIAIETLYPNPQRPGQWWIDSWDEHQQLLESGLNFVVDLSHMNIIAHHEGRNDSLVSEMMASDRLIELHLSMNDGRSDSHASLAGADQMWWFPLLQKVNPKADWFSEGILSKG